MLVEAQSRQGGCAWCKLFVHCPSNRSLAQKRLSIYNWNPGPRRGKEGAFEKQNAGRWHVITLQEAAEYVDHVLLTSRFHVTHHAGCAILFNKDTFYSNIDVKSIYLHDIRRVAPPGFRRLAQQGEHGRHISLKERLASYHHGQQKRRFG